MKIKKITLFVGFMLMFSMPVFSAVGFGLKGGLNIAGISYETAEDMSKVTIENRIGFAGGVFLLVKFNDYFGLQPELLYSQKGFTMKYSTSTTIGAEIYKQDSTDDCAMDYIELPVLLKICIPVGNIYPNLVIGPSFGFLCNAKSTVNAKAQYYNGYTWTTLYTDSATQDIKASLEGIDTAIAFGAGVDFDMGGSFITLDLRYSIGLTNTLIDKNNQSVTNNVFSVSLGYAFGNYTDKKKEKINRNTESEKESNVENNEDSDESVSADKETVGNLIKKGKKAYDEEDYNRALKLFKEAFSDGETADLDIKIGDCYYKKKNIESAVKYYKKAIKLEPNSDLKNFIKQLEKTE